MICDCGHPGDRCSSDSGRRTGAVKLRLVARSGKTRNHRILPLSDQSVHLNYPVTHENGGSEEPPIPDLAPLVGVLVMQPVCASCSRNRRSGGRIRRTKWFRTNFCYFKHYLNLSPFSMRLYSALSLTSFLPSR